MSPDCHVLFYVLTPRYQKPCASILKAFEFPPTLVKFNPATTLLVACSADNSIRVVSIPADVSSSSMFLYSFATLNSLNSSHIGFVFSFSIVFAILVILLAIAVRFYGLKVLSW